MRQLIFEERYREFWQTFERDLLILEQKKQAPSKELAEGFVQNYRTLCQHLALALERHYSGGLTDYLQFLCERGHKILYAEQKMSLFDGFWHFVRYGLPQTVRQQKTLVLWAHALFYLPLLLAFLLTALMPEQSMGIIGLDYGPSAALAYEEMKDRYETARNREMSLNFIMTAWYIWNNIGIAFRMFASGLLFGFGTVYMSLFNGWVIGGVMGYMIHASSGAAFFSFIGAHGAFELTGIVLAAAGGLRLGLSLLKPGTLSRRDALRVQGGQAAQLVCGAFLLLFIAAFVEGFWSPITSIPMALKYLVAFVLWVAVYAYLWLGGRPQKGRA